MTITNETKKGLGLNSKANKEKKNKLRLKKKLMAKKQQNAEKLKDDENKSTSIKKPITQKQNNSPVNQENKKKQNKLNDEKNNTGNKNANNIGKKPNNGDKKNMSKNAKKKNPKDEQQQKNVEKNTEKSNPQDEQNSSAFCKQKNVHKMKITVDTVPCPKDIQTQIKNRELDKNDRTLFVRFDRENGLKDRQILMKTFGDKVKDIRYHRKYKNINFVEFESSEHLEEIKSQIEQMQTTGEKAVVDYMGDKGKFGSQNQQINPNKLFISGLPKGTTLLQVKSLFEKCSKVTIPKSKLSGGKSYGFIFFDNESDAKAAFESGQNIQIGGADVTVVYSKVKTNETLKSSEKRPLPDDNEKGNQVDESPSKKQHIDKEEMEVQEKEDKEEEKDKVDEVKKVSDDQEDMDEDEEKDLDDTKDVDEDEEEGDDKESDESADDENESDDDDTDDDDKGDDGGDDDDDDDDDSDEDDE